MDEAETQWYNARMVSRDGLTTEFMERIWQQGVIGMKEFRTWLANNFITFADVRDPAVDAMIDEVARTRFERARYPQEENNPEETETP
jgi:hypothetical protein